MIGLGFYLTGGLLPAADYVIAVIDPTRIVEQSPQYEAARAQLEEEVNDREQKLAEQQKRLSELQQKLERDAALMSEEELQRLQTDIRNRGRKVKYAQAEFREDFSLRQNELRTKLARQVEEVVAELAREENIDLILSEGMVYVSKRIDISDKIIMRLKEKFEASKGL
nr:OmpH family outer membrane protein [Candidatus Thiosymbion oneisti]